ncbi:emp24/gp25L/p24 family/GOLD [Lotmaria passim]
MAAASTRLFLVALTLLALTAAIAATASKSPYSLFSGVYVKLLPGKELCLNYHAYRDPQEDPVTVALEHRCIDPRLAEIRTRLYAPSSEPGKRGREIPLDDKLDTFGENTQIFFKAEQTGTYKMCFLLPLMKPAMRFEMSFSAVNDVVEPPMLEDDAFVVDKPPEMSDYAERLYMMNISLETTVDELRLYQARRSFFDHTTKSAFNLCLFSVLLNIVIAVGVSMWSERYLERYYVKQKIA